MPDARFLARRSGGAGGSRRPDANGKSKALEYYRESVVLARTMGYVGQVANCLLGIAVIALASGGARDAATLLGSFAGLIEGFGNLEPWEQDEFDAAIAQARAALGNEHFDAAWAEGGSLNLDQAVDLSLTVTASPAIGPATT